MLNKATVIAMLSFFHVQEAIAAPQGQQFKSFNTLSGSTCYSAVPSQGTASSSETWWQIENLGPRQAAAGIRTPGCNFSLLAFLALPSVHIFEAFSYHLKLKLQQSPHRTSCFCSLLFHAVWLLRETFSSPDGELVINVASVGPPTHNSAASASRLLEYQVYTTTTSFSMCVFRFIWLCVHI